MAFAKTLQTQRPARNTGRCTTQSHNSLLTQRPAAKRSLRRDQCSVVAKAAEGTETSAPAKDIGTQDWIPVIAPEELPKGVRKEVRVEGKSVLLFWYRNQIYAIDARSPAEGAYSEGFIKSKFTQDYGIECPTTGSIFSLKDGNVVDFYPTNPILRAVTPLPDKLPIYPVKLTQDAIMIALAGTEATPATRGGADTSLENNNVFAVMPSSYVVGSEQDDKEKSTGPVDVSTVATFSVAIAAFGIIAVAGTATAAYYEDPLLLGLFWATMLGFGGYFAWQYKQGNE